MLNNFTFFYLYVSTLDMCHHTVNQTREKQTTKFKQDYFKKMKNVITVSNDFSKFFILLSLISILFIVLDVEI